MATPGGFPAILEEEQSIRDRPCMATLTLRFKGNPIQIHRCDSGIVTIGRDADNTICIDSPTVAPKHVLIDLDHPQAPRLLREDDHLPVKVNGQPVERCDLTDGDTIELGDYTLVFNNEVHYAPKPGFSGPEAVLQFLNGKNIGRVVPLKHTLTRLGRAGNGVAVIARRKNGYFLSSLEGGENIRINGQPLGERTVQLQAGDEIEIDHNRMLFHAES